MSHLYFHLILTLTREVVAMWVKKLRLQRRVGGSNPLFNRTFLKKCKFKFEPISLGAVLSVLPTFYDTFYFTISVVREMATLCAIKSRPMRHI